MTTTATRPVTQETPKASSRERSRRAVAVSMAADAAGSVKTVAEDAATRVPAIASMGRSAFDDASHRIQASSDEMVRLGTVLSFGFAAGLLIGGAPRILVHRCWSPVDDEGRGRALTPGACGPL
jgi:hypothetical protein